jgi:hypothetical protein
VPRLRQFVLQLDRPEQLFEADPISPMSARYTEYTAQPAMDTIRDLLLMRMPPRDTAVQIDVMLPADRVTPGLDEELTTAVRRWVHVQNTMDVESTEAGGAVGWRLFAIGVVAFFALQITSIWVRQKANDYDGYLVDSLGEGLSVASWVMLWFPLQIATMEVWRATLRRRRMGVIERVTVRVLPAKPAPESS